MSSQTTDANQGCVGPDAPDAGRNERCAGCPNRGACASGQGGVLEHDAEQISVRFSTIKHVILILSGKGGVGKSTVATQLAFTLAHLNKQVGLLDLDLCGPSIPRMTGVRGQNVRPSTTGWCPVYAEDNLNVMSIGFLLGAEDDPIIWKGPKKNNMIKQFLFEVEWGNLDYLIIDTPPGTSDEHISISQYLQRIPSTLSAILVTTPQEISMMDVRKEITFCNKSSIKILGVIENMSNFLNEVSDIKFINKKGEDMTENVKSLLQNNYPELLRYRISCPIFIPYGSGPKGMCEKFGLKLIGKIPLATKLLLSCEDGYSYIVREPEGCAALSLMSISSDIIKLVEGHSE